MCRGECTFAGRGCLKESGAKVEYLGLLHSHPQWKKSRKDNDLFSPGDAVVSVLSGKIYLTTPHGEVYALDKKEGKKIIVPGILRDSIVFHHNLVDMIKSLPKNELTALKVAFPLQFLSEYLYEKAVKPINDRFVSDHDAVSSGRNFQTFDANTYDTRLS